MKKTVIGMMLAAATLFSASSFAADKYSPVDVPGSGAAMEAGFEAWGQSEVQVGPTGGQVLEHEAQSWAATYNKIYGSKA